MMRRLLVAFMLIVAAAGALYAFLPRRADLRRFDPGRVARLEIAMWRDYYDHRYPAMFGQLYRLERGVYGFSPWDSARIAWYAAMAARQFQPTRSRAEAERATPALESYYAIIRNRSGERFDPARAARLELDWWQLRREQATPQEYGAVVAKTAEEVFGTSGDSLTESALLRAEMMHYRDERRNGAMRPADWDYVESNLARSHQMLKSAIARP